MQDYLDGTIYRVEEDYVLCHMKLPVEGEDVEITLDNEVFKRCGIDIWYGKPFTLTVVKGCPMVSNRIIDHTPDKRSEELRKLVEDSFNNEENKI